MDFEKIKSEVSAEYISKLVKQDSFADNLVESMVKISSEISKQMLIKYHEELNSK